MYLKREPIACGFPSLAEPARQLLCTWPNSIDTGLSMKRLECCGSSMSLRKGPSWNEAMASANLNSEFCWLHEDIDLEGYGLLADIEIT